MLGQEDGRSQLAVDLAEGGKKIRCGDRVKLACRLVENQNLRLEHHDRCKIQKLLLPAGQLRDRLVKPFLNPEKRCHFCNAAANGRRVIAEGFKTKCQLVPDLIRDDLILRALLHKPDLLSLFALGQLVELLSVEQDFAASASVRREDGFELPEQRTFTAPGRTAEDQELARLDRQCEVGNCLFFLFGICKR